MTKVGWAEWDDAELLAVTGTLPAAEHARTISEILLAGPTAEERHQLRREKAVEDARRAEMRDVADSVDAVAFRARINGTAAAHNPLAEAAAEPFRDREAAGRRRRAIDILREHGLEDVLGASSGVIFDRYLGVLEAPGPDTRQLDIQYESGRAEAEAEARRQRINHYRSHRIEYR
jgi:hypothetical protein